MIFFFFLYSRGQLGHGELTVDKVTQPTLVESFEGIHVTSVASGGWHSTAVTGKVPFKGIYSCPMAVISGITNKAQFQHLNGLKWSQEESYLYKTNFFHFIRKCLNPSWDHFITP